METIQKTIKSIFTQNKTAFSLKIKIVFTEFIFIISYFQPYY